MGLAGLPEEVRGGKNSEKETKKDRNSRGPSASRKCAVQSNIAMPLQLLPFLVSSVCSPLPETEKDLSQEQERRQREKKKTSISTNYLFFS